MLSGSRLKAWKAWSSKKIPFHFWPWLTAVYKELLRHQRVSAALLFGLPTTLLSTLHHHRNDVSIFSCFLTFVFIDLCFMLMKIYLLWKFFSCLTCDFSKISTVFNLWFSCYLSLLKDFSLVRLVIFLRLQKCLTCDFYVIF